MKKKPTLVAFISAFALHIIIGVLLLISVDFSLPREKPKSPVIEASLVNQKLFDDLASRKKEKKQAEEKRRKTEAARIKEEKEAAKAKKIAEAKRKQQEAERVKAKKLAEEKRQREKAERIKAEKIAKAKAAKEKAEKVAREKAAKEKAEKLAREKAAKEKAEKIAREKAAKEKAQKIAREKAAKEKADKIAKEKERQRQAELDKQMEAEFADDFSSAQSAKQLSEIARYTALIKDKISRNWQVPPNMKGKSCKLSIRLAHDGLVLSVKRSRGDVTLCESARRAALKAKTLPIPKDPGIAPQFRDFDITVEPDL